MGFCVAGEPQATFVSHFAQRFAKHQTGIRGKHIDPPSTCFTSQNRVILIRKIASQAQLESALTCGRSMAGTHVAIGLTEGWNHIVTERYGIRCIHACYRDFDHRRRAAWDLCHDGRAAVCNGDHPSGLQDFGHFVVG